MEGEILNSDAARNSAPMHDTARHSLTITQASELFAELGVPRSKRSVQRFCEQGHLDFVSVKTVRGDQYFINRESVIRYAEELRQIEAVATIGVEARHDAPERDRARYNATDRDTPSEVPVVEQPQQQREQHTASAEQSELQRITDENLNLKIDNKAKEIAIAQLNRRLDEDRDRFLNAMQDMSYKLGAAETRLAQIEAPKGDSDGLRQSATERDTAPVEAVIVSPAPEPAASQPKPTAAPIPQPEQKRGWWRW